MDEAGLILNVSSSEDQRWGNGMEAKAHVFEDVCAGRGLSVSVCSQSTVSFSLKFFTKPCSVVFVESLFENISVCGV